MNQEPVNCLSWDGGRTVNHGSCDNRNGTVQICRYGVYHNPNPGECGTTAASPVVQPPVQQPPPTQICTPNTKTCLGSYRIKVCNAKGTDETLQNCPANQQCIDNECRIPVQPPVESSEKFCSSFGPHGTT